MSAPMRTRALHRAALVLALLLPHAAVAQAPTVDKVEPPNWWGAHHLNPVRLLVHGAHLTGARFSCGTLRCGVATTNAAGSYAFVDVTIPPGTRPGAYPLTLRTASGSAKVPFTVSAPLASVGRFQGFGPQDAMYLIMPDRFANGDTTNDRTPKSPAILDRQKGRWYHGGDLAGVRQKLPYLQSLGITAIWLNPIYDNTDREDTKEVYDGQTTTGYHGYGAIDFYGVDEHLGTVAEFRELVDAAHRHGIKIILDMVANHTGPYHPWVKDAPTPTWFHGTEAQHPNNDWQTWTLADPSGTAALRRNTLDGWFVNILPDLNQDDSEVARYIIQNTLWWVGISGLDGIRQDTWPYVPRTFWRDWMSSIKRQYPSLRVVGEVLDGDPAMISFFEGSRVGFDGLRTGVDKMFDFPLHFTIRKVFGEGQSIRQIPQLLAHDQLYQDPTALVTLLGLHDVPRFMHETGATAAGLKLAYTLLLTIRGTPLLYYGDEIALRGGGDPDNRRDFPGGWSGDARDAFTPAGRTVEEQSVFAHVQTLLALRKARPALTSAATAHLLATDQAFVYRRGTGAQTATIALNNGTTPVTVTVDGAVGARDALGVCGAPVSTGSGAARRTTITIPARAGCIY